VHALQEEFLKAQAAAKPAARVTRISRKPAAEASAPAQAVAPAAPPAKDGSQQVGHFSSSGTSGGGLHISSAAQQQQDDNTDASAVGAAATGVCEPSICPAIPGILFDVKERNVGPVAAAAVPPTAAGAASFPAAVHRKQSKVRSVT
jgi:hypothetical protein